MPTPEQIAWIESQFPDVQSGCPEWWRVILAVAAHESGCGTSRLYREANNALGIKAVGRQARADRIGHRRFESTEACYRACCRVILKSTYYPHVREAILEGQRNGDDSRAIERAIIHNLTLPAHELATVRERYPEAQQYCEGDPLWAVKVLHWHDVVWQIDVTMWE